MEATFANFMPEVYTKSSIFQYIGGYYMSISCVMDRRSVRQYTDRPVDDETLEKLLRAGMYAPSAMNSQPWEFIAVRDRAILDKLSEGAPYWKMLKSAPLAIVIAADISEYKASHKDFFIQDCSASAQNILVAAEGLGLGGVWLGTLPVEDRMEHVRKTLAIPDGIIPFVILPIGWPSEHPHPHTSYHGEKVHYDKY